VRAHRAQIGTERGEVDRDVPNGHARVDVDEHTLLPARPRDLTRGLERADLVVGELHADERGCGPDRVDHLGGVVAALLVDADDGDVGAASVAGVEHGGVLDGRRDHVPGRVGAGDAAPHGGVDGFRAAGGEDDLARPGAEQTRDLFAGVLEGDACHATFGVQAAGIGVVGPQERQHRLERGRAEW
jgi:hypothetical protein